MSTQNEHSKESSNSELKLSTQNAHSNQKSNEQFEKTRILKILKAYHDDRDSGSHGGYWRTYHKI